MNPSPTANRSFLHSHKAALISDKVVYATLDSLALKRTRLPLQLLPVSDDNVEKTEKADKEKRPAGGKTLPKNTICKVRRYRCGNTIIQFSFVAQSKYGFAHYEARARYILEKSQSNFSLWFYGYVSYATIQNKLYSVLLTLYFTVVSSRSHSFRIFLFIFCSVTFSFSLFHMNCVMICTNSRAIKPQRI